MAKKKTESENKVKEAKIPINAQEDTDIEADATEEYNKFIHSMLSSTPADEEDCAERRKVFSNLGPVPRFAQPCIDPYGFKAVADCAKGYFCNLDNHQDYDDHITNLFSIAMANILETAKQGLIKTGGYIDLDIVDAIALTSGGMLIAISAPNKNGARNSYIPYILNGALNGIKLPLLGMEFTPHYVNNFCNNPQAPMQGPTPETRKKSLKNLATRRGSSRDFNLVMVVSVKYTKDHTIKYDIVHAEHALAIANIFKTKPLPNLTIIQ